MPDEQQDPEQDAPDASPSEEPKTSVPVEDWIQHPQSDWIEDRPVPAYGGKRYKSPFDKRDDETGESPPPEK